MVNHRFKLLYITLEYGTEISGGIGRVVNSLTHWLSPKIDIHVLLIRNYRVFKYTRLYKLKEKQPFSKVQPRILGHFRPELLIHLIQKEHYDAVHVFHASEITAAAVKGIREYFPGLKIIYSCHSILKYDATIRNNHPDLLQYEAEIIRRVSHLHLLNQTSLQYFCSAYGPIPEQSFFSIIPNGVEGESLPTKPPRLGLMISRIFADKEKLNVLCMSRWSWGKGLEYLLDAIPMVAERSPNIRFIITGRRFMSWEYRYMNYQWKILQKMAGLKDYLIPLGWMNDPERNQLLAAAHIWVMPSQLEYFPYSILEPMMARIPIISARIASVVEMLRENEDCLFYDPQSPEQLADRILTLIQQPDLRRKLAENAHGQAKKYQWPRIAELYLEMYQAVIGVK